MSRASPLHDVDQDAAFVAPWGAGVADGVGGGPAGDIASSVLVRRVAEGVDGAQGPLELEDAALLLGQANSALRARILRDPSCDGMATTFTGLFASPSGGLLVAHAGDSRAYLMRDGALSRETRDDSFVQLLVESGVVRPGDAASHPQRNVITASLRGADQDVVAFTEREARIGDRWLLCTDGVSDYVGDHELQAALTAADPTTAAERIVTLAQAANSRDDVTAIVCDVVAASDALAEGSFAGSADADAEGDSVWERASA
ncbi:PP2C family serine/threonine-protein phosphatase [Microbacterium sp. SS28]|uniref:PP2C family protein-serine/threonine phosphatase n=1 Tax=Microbacterium sp. SS28 TaxID=2919948 RepID=UPI001FAA2B4C|nr:protein phosphatase 2C domain-containing protein [Microbacterium sp. SS28]